MGMMSPSYSDVFGTFVDYVSCLDVTAMEILFDEIRKRRVKCPSSVDANYLSKVNRDYSFKYSNDRYYAGDGFVYVWVTDGGEIFYIGCGGSERINNTIGRSKEFADVLQQHKCCAYTIAEFVNKKYALEIETLCIHYLQLAGYDLTNHSKMLSHKEVRFLRRKTANPDIEASEHYEDLYADHDSLKRQYVEVIETLDKFIAFCQSQELASSKDRSAEPD